MADNYVDPWEKKSGGLFGIGDTEDKSTDKYVDPWAGRNEVQEPSSMLRRTVGDFGVALARGALVGIPEMVTGLADIPTMGYAGKAVEAVGKGLGIGGFQEGRETINQLLTPETKQGQQNVSEAFQRGAWEGIKEAATTPSAVAQVVGESVPSMLVGGGVTGKVAKGLGYGMKEIPAAARLAAGGEKAIKEGMSAAQVAGIKTVQEVSRANFAKAATIGGISEGLVTAGQNIEGIRQQTPDQLLTLDQIGLGVASAAATGVIGVLGGRLAARLHLADPQTMAAMLGTGGIARNAVEHSTWKQSLLTLVKTMVKEGLIEELPQSMQEQVAQNLALGKPVTEGVLEQGVMGMLAGMAQGGGAHIVQALLPERSKVQEAVDADPTTQEITALANETDPTIAAELDRVKNLAEETVNAPKIAAKEQAIEKGMAEVANKVIESAQTNAEPPVTMKVLEGMDQTRLEALFTEQPDTPIGRAALALWKKNATNAEKLLREKKPVPKAKTAAKPKQAEVKEEKQAAKTTVAKPATEEGLDEFDASELKRLNRSIKAVGDVLATQRQRLDAVKADSYPNEEARARAVFDQESAIKKLENNIASDTAYRDQLENKQKKAGEAVPKAGSGRIENVYSPDQDNKPSLHVKSANGNEYLFEMVGADQNGPTWRVSQKQKDGKYVDGKLSIEAQKQFGSVKKLLTHLVGDDESIRAVEALSEEIGKDGSAYVRAIYNAKYLSRYSKEGTEQNKKQKEYAGQAQYGLSDISPEKFAEYEKRADALWGKTSVTETPEQERSRLKAEERKRKREEFQKDLKKAEEFKKAEEAPVGEAPKTEAVQVEPRDTTPETEYQNKYVPRKQGLIANENTEANVYDEREGFFSDSHYYVKQKPPKGVTAKTKSLNMGDINPAFPDADPVNELEHREFAEEGWALPAEIVGEYKEKGSTVPKAQIVLRDGEKFNDKRKFAVEAKYVDAILTKHPDAKAFVSETEKLSTLVFTKGEGEEIVGLVVISEAPKEVIEKKPPAGAYEANVRMVKSFPNAKDITNIPTKEEYDIAYKTVRADVNSQEFTASDVMRHLLFAMNPAAFPEDQNMTIVGKLKKAIEKKEKISTSFAETATSREKSKTAITYPARTEPYEPADVREMEKLADKIPVIKDLIRYLESTGYKEGKYGQTTTVVKNKGREPDSISSDEDGQRRELDAQDATFSRTESDRFGKLRELIAEKGKAIDAFMALEAKRQNLLKTYSLIKGRKKGYFQRELLSIEEEIAGLEDQMAKMEIPKTFELDTTAYDQQSKEARDLGGINGFKVIFFVDHTNTLNGFINHEDKIIFINRNSQKTPVEITGHELSHQGVEGYESNEETQKKIDTTSKAFKAYREALSFLVLGPKNYLLGERQALAEYAADLQGGMTDNYGVILNEGLFYANGEPADSVSDSPRMAVDVIAKRPIWSRFKSRSDLRSTNDKGTIFILSRGKDPVPIGMVLNDYKKDVRPMRLKGLIAAFSKNNIALSFDSTMMKDRTLLTEYNADENVIFVNVEAFKEVTDAAARFENSVLATGIKALLEISQKSKFDQPRARLKSEVINLMRSIYPYVVDAPENVQKIVLRAKEEGILAYITNPDFAGWLDSIPHFRKKGERETLWTRLRDAVLRYVGVASTEGMTKLDAFIEILDRNVYTKKSPAEISNSEINEARKFKSADAYIAAKSHYKYQRTSTRVRGIIPNEYIYSHKVTVKVDGKKIQKVAKDVVYEPATLEDAIASKWTPEDMKGTKEAGKPWTKEVNTMVERYEKLRDEIGENDEKTWAYEAIQNELIAKLMPIAWRHAELRNIYETAHGLRSTQKYFNSPELQRIADQEEAYIGESEGLGMPIMTLSKGVTVTNLRENVKDVEIKATQITEEEQEKVPALDEIVEPEFLVLARSLLNARSTAEKEGVKAHIRGKIDNIYHYEPEDKRILRAESIILEVEKAVNDLSVYNQAQKKNLLGQNKRLSFLSLTARGRWRRKSGVPVETTVPEASLPNELWKLKTKAGIKLTPEEMQAYQVQQKTEKQKTKLEKPETEATNQWIVRKYRQEIAVLTMDTSGDIIKITGMVGEQASILDAIAGVFRNNPKKKTIEVTLDPETDQLSRETQANLMTTLSLFGGSYVDGVMTLNRDNFTSSVEAVRQTDDIPKDKLEAKIFAHIRGEEIVKATEKAVRQNTFLTAEEERYLIETYHTTTDPKAKAMAMSRIIDGLQKFVGGIANAEGYKKLILNKPSIEIQDLVNEGNIGLITALNRYDISKESGRLSTYAKKWIFAAINDYVKQGATHKNIRNVIAKAEDAIRGKGGTVTAESIQANLKAAGKKIKLSTIENALALRMMDNAATLNLGGEESTSLINTLRDSAFTGEEKHLTANARILLQNLYGQLMGTLTDVEQAVIRGTVLEERKQKDIAADLGISQQSVSNIEKQAFAKMMKKLEQDGIGKYTTDADGNEVFKRNRTIEGEGEQADSLWEAQVVGERALTADDIISGSFMDNIIDRARNFPTMISEEYAKITQKQVTENVVDNLHKMSNADRKRFDGLAMQYGGIRHRTWRKIFSLPWQNAKKSADWMKAFLISVRRISARDEMAHDWVKIGQPFLKMGAYLKSKGFSKEEARKIKSDIYRFIIQGDENLPTKIADLREQAKAETNEQKKKELEAKIARYEEFRSYLPEDAEQGIKDYDGKLIKLHPVAYDIYRSAMMTEQSIFKKLIDHAETMLFMQYKKQAWFKIMANAFGEDTSREFTLLVGKALKGISTEEGVKSIDEQGIKIQFRDIFKTINSEYDAIMSEKTKASVAESYDKLFKAISSQIADLKKILQKLEPNMGSDEIDRSIREMIVAYQYTRPRLQKIKTLRNEWRNWPGFFPRLRERGKYKFVAYRNEFDGDVVVKKEVYSAMFNSMGETDQLYGDMLKKLNLKELPDTYETNILPVSELPDYMFEGIKDFNIEALVNSAVEKMDVKGVYFDEAGREVDVRREIWDSVMESIAGQFQARAAAAHGTHRKQGLGEKAIKGYQEDNLGDVLSNHITMMAGFLTKQTAAFEYLELMQELQDKTRKAELQEYVNGQLRNDTGLDRASSKMRSFAFLWFLGGMIKSAVVNSTQPYVVGIPEMAKWMRDNNIKGSATLMQLKMSWAIAKNFRILYQDPDAWVEIKLVKAGPYATDAQKEAAADLNMALVTYLRENIINGIMAAQHMRFIKGELSGSFSGKYNKLFDILAFPFAMAEKNNRMTSGGAMFAIAYANYRKTMPADKAYDKASEAATEFINNVHYPIGKHNLPILAQSGTGLGVTAKTLYTFRPFTHNFLLNQFNMLRSSRHLFSKDAKERARASSDLKTVIHTMALMALFGGFLGLPFMKDLLDFHEKHFGGSWKQWLRKTLRSAGGEHLETLGMYGIPGLLGANLSGSLAIGIPFFGDQSNLDTVFGVYAGLGKKGVMAAQALGRGDYYRVMANLSPEFLRGPVVSLTESDFGRKTFGFRGYATTPKGLPSYATTGEPLKYEGSEIGLKMLGFQPTRISKEREIEQTVKKQVMWANEKKQQISESYRIDRLQRNPEAMRTMMSSVKALNIKIKNEKIPVPRANISSIIKNSRHTKNLQKRRELARRMEMEAQ